MNSQDFTNFYTKQDSDETITPFQDEAGFSLIRPYPEGTPYNKDGRRMFIKVAALERGLYYVVDMTKPEKRGESTEYVITDGEEYKRKVTNFFSDGEEFSFDGTSKKIVHLPTKKSFTLNEFVTILVANHLSDRLFIKRYLNMVTNVILKLLFWLSDKHYERVRVSLDKYHFSREGKPVLEEKGDTEPFFKYFYISKNFIFSILLIAFFVAILAIIFPYTISAESIWHSFFGEFSLSNPMVVLFFFLVLFSSEKLSIWLNRKIKDFFVPEKDYRSGQTENFIEKMHNFQLQNKFKIKLNSFPNKIFNGIPFVERILGLKDEFVKK